MRTGGNASGASAFDERYFEDPNYPPGLKGGDEVRGYGYYPDYFPIVEAQLSSLVELTEAASLVDVGCGKGALAAYARQDFDLNVTGVDASAYAVAHAHRSHGGEQTVRAAGMRLPFAAESFDAGWCNGVLQYLEGADARAALGELGRVCRRAVFVSNIAAAQRQTEWGRRDRLTRLYLRPRQWAAMAQMVLNGDAEAEAWASVPLPFEGESAILLYRRDRCASTLPMRLVELSLERMRRLGALTRQPPGMDRFYRAQAR